MPPAHCPTANSVSPAVAAMHQACGNDCAALDDGLTIALRALDGAVATDDRAAAAHQCCFFLFRMGLGERLIEMSDTALPLLRKASMSRGVRGDIALGWYLCLRCRAVWHCHSPCDRRLPSGR